MNRSDSILRAARIAVPTLVTLTVLLRTLALCLAFDRAPGYFRSGAVLPILYYIILGVSAIAFCALPFLVRDRALLPAEAPLSLGRLVAAGVMSLLAAVNAIYLFANADSTAAPALLCALAAMALLAGGAHFLLHFLGERARTARVLCGYAMILAAVLLLSATYFDLRTPMNAPHKVGLHVCMLAIMGSLLADQRAALGRNKPRALAALSLLALLITATVGVSGVVAYLAGVYTDTLYLLQDLLTVGYALFVGTRIFVGNATVESEAVT
ncbi:MAG: hypothetical protein IJA78_02240 [Clostridia bacterium]|nr:hypothetical protein [Clostridia bacterium]MBQ3482976.1 hypothetical protein [Clostridia bacterium]